MICALLCAMLCFALCACDKELIEPSEEFYVNDRAGVLSEDTKALILYNAERLYEACGAQIVVASTQTLGGLMIDEACTKLYNSWKIGDAEKNNGFLLLLMITPDPNDGDYYLAVGQGAESILSNSEASDLLLDVLEPCFAKGEYDEGVLNLYSELFNRICGYYGLDLSFRAALMTIA